MDLLNAAQEIETDSTLDQFLTTPHYALILGLISLAWAQEQDHNLGELTRLPPAQWSFSASQMTNVLLSTIWPAHLTEHQAQVSESTTVPTMRQLKLFNVWDTCVNTHEHFVLNGYLELLVQCEEPTPTDTQTWPLPRCGGLPKS